MTITLDDLLARNNMDEHGLERFLNAAWSVVVSYDMLSTDDIDALAVRPLVNACGRLAKVGETETMKRWQESQEPAIAI